MKKLIITIAIICLPTMAGAQQRTTNFQVWHTPNSTTYYNYDTGHADTFYDPSPRRDIRPLEPILRPEEPMIPKIPMPGKVFKQRRQVDDDDDD